MKKTMAVALAAVLIPLSGTVACQAIEDRARDEVDRQVDRGRQRVNDEIDRGQQRLNEEITNAQNEAERRTGGGQ